MKNRFDLENDITAMYSSAEDLKTIVQMMYDSDFIYDKDRTWNVLYGLAEIIEAKVGKLEDTFEQVFGLNEYAPRELKEARDEALARAKVMMDAWNEVTNDFYADEDKEGM